MTNLHPSLVQEVSVRPTLTAVSTLNKTAAM